MQHHEAFRLNTDAGEGSPDALVESFRAELADLANTWGALVDSVESLIWPYTYEPGEVARRVTLDAFLRLAVTWEAFRSEWYIAAVCRNPVRFQEVVGETVRHAVGATRYRAATAYMRIEWPTPLPPASVRELLDSDGRHLTFDASKSWRSRAAKELPEPYAPAVGRQLDESLVFLDFVASARNWLAHGSRGAHARFLTAAKSQFHLPVPTKLETQHDFADWLLTRSDDGDGTIFADCVIIVDAIAATLAEHPTG